MNNKAYEERLQEQKALLLKCQEDHGLKSCLNCEQIFSCLQRRNYVDTVYASMHKGQSGNFDF